MNNKAGIALTELVKDLGYEEPGKLSNKIRDIIKDKEDFSDRFSIPTKLSGRKDGRPEKHMVKEEARVFVDNLCILHLYKGLFKKASLKTYSPYRCLLNNGQNTSMRTRIQQHKRSLEIEKSRSEDALEQLPRFSALLEDNKPIDITSQSLRDLLSKCEKSSKIIDFSKAFEIGAWNELVILKDQLEEKGETSERYFNIGEKMIELGEVDGAIEALDEATGLDPKNGIAWALKAQTFLDLLWKSKKERLEAHSKTDFSGFIEHPLNGEEHSINARIEYTDSTSEDLHQLFIESAFSALENWPQWECGIEKGRKKYMNYQYSVHAAGNEIQRDQLFFYLVIELKESNFFAFRWDDRQKEVITQTVDRFLQLFREFQKRDYAGHPIPQLLLHPFSPEYQGLTTFKVKLLEVLSWVSIKDANLALDYLVSEIEKNEVGASEHVYILTKSPIRQMLWNHLGSEKYTELTQACQERVFQRQRIAFWISFSDLLLKGMRKHMVPVSELLSLKEHPDDRYGRGSFKIKKWSPAAFTKHLRKASESIAGWRKLLNEEVWENEPYSPELPREILAAVWFGSVLEIMNGKDLNFNFKILAGFTKKDHGLKSVIEYAISPMDKPFFPNDSFPLLMNYLRVPISDELRVTQ